MYYLSSARLHDRRYQQGDQMGTDTFADMHKVKFAMWCQKAGLARARVPNIAAIQSIGYPYLPDRRSESRFFTLFFFFFKNIIQAKYVQHCRCSFSLFCINPEKKNENEKYNYFTLSLGLFPTPLDLRLRFFFGDGRYIRNTGIPSYRWVVINSPLNPPPNLISGRHETH